MGHPAESCFVDSTKCEITKCTVLCIIPFQEREGRVYIADDMGLGKTIQALATAAAFRQEWPLLVVCPSSMRFAWKDAAVKWIPGLDPDDVTVITSGKDYLCNGKMLVISYDLLSRKESELLKKDYKVSSHIFNIHKDG